MPDLVPVYVAMIWTISQLFWRLVLKYRQIFTLHLSYRCRRSPSPLNPTDVNGGGFESRHLSKNVAWSFWKVFNCITQSQRYVGQQTKFSMLDIAWKHDWLSFATGWANCIQPGRAGYSLPITRLKSQPMISFIADHLLWLIPFIQTSW